MRVQVWSDTDKPRFGRCFDRAAGHRLGYRARYELRPVGNDYLQTVGDSRTGAQIGMFGWVADYPRALDVFTLAFRLRGADPCFARNLNDSSSATVGSTCAHQARQRRLPGVAGRARNAGSWS